MPVINTQDLPADFPRKGRILALDVGSKFIGLALSNSTQTLASPRPALARTKWNQDINFFKEIIDNEGIVSLIAGHPLTLDGTVGPAADAARSYADLCATAFPLPVVLWDERLSTAAAERALFEQRTGRQTRASKRDIKQHLDSAAAVLILQNFLDFLSQPRLAR